jgi:hypothetical protein
VVSLTGRDALSVKPAASEISLGRSKAVFINHEIGGSFVRWARAENAVFIAGTLAKMGDV